MAGALMPAMAQDRAMSPMSAFGRRAATTMVAIPALVWIIAGAPSWLFPVLIVMAAGAATHELVGLLERAGQPTPGPLVVGLGSAVAASFAVGHVVMAPTAALVLASMIVLAVPLWRTGALSAAPAAMALLAFVYVGVMLGHAVWLHRLPEGPWLLLVLLGTTWVGETAAYLVGSTLGRHKLAPVVSPNKTVEGALAQVITSVLAAVGLGAWLVPTASVAFWAGAGALLGVVGQIGDLVESAIKRSAKAKDAGGIIPGHGGLLDRLDSLLFNLPAFFYYVVLTGGRA